MCEFKKRLQTLRENTQTQLDLNKAEQDMSFLVDLVQKCDINKLSTTELNLAEVNIIEEFQSFTQVHGQTMAGTIEDDITTSTEKLIRDGAETPKHRQTFQQRMEKHRQRAKEAAKKQINAVFDKAINLAEKYPKLEKAIEITTIKAVDGFFNLLNRIGNFILNAVNQVIEWIRNAWQSIADTFTSIANSIANWFTGHFTALRTTPNTPTQA